jgi:hypothetical protein
MKMDLEPSLELNLVTNLELIPDADPSLELDLLPSPEHDLGSGLYWILVWTGSLSGLDPGLYWIQILA